jgi:GntR family transcriptional regulator of arabinose operon
MGQLYKKIYLNILQEIKNGQLKSGDRIPSENELTEKFNVSRITTKKALDMLAQRNIIERYRGKGSFVANDLPDIVLNKNELLPCSSSTSHIEKEKLVGFILPGFGEAFGTRLLKAIEERCSDHNLHMIMKQTLGRPEEEERAINSLLQLGVSGLIVLPSPGKHFNNELLRLVVNNFPLVLVDRYLKGIPSSSVCINNKKASMKLTKQLLDMGHEKIAFLSPFPDGTSSVEDRLTGFQFAVSEKGLRLNSNTTVMYLTQKLQIDGAEEKLNVPYDRQTIKEFIINNPQVTAFLACEYEIAVMIHQELSLLGRKVPEDCMIVTFDSPSTLGEGPLYTHILQNEKRMGSEAVDLLVSQMKGNRVPIHSEVDFSLIKSKHHHPLAGIK